MGKMSFFLHAVVATSEIVIWENVHLGKCTFGKLLLGKLHIWEVATWEIITWEVALGKMFLGKYLTPYTVHFQFKTLFGLGCLNRFFVDIFFEYTWFGKPYSNIKYISFSKLTEL